MSKYASWTRVEPDPRAIDPRPGAQAPLADPFWLLGRQWWIGELEGHDGGTPVAADVHLATATVGEDGADSRHTVISSALAAPIARAGDHHSAHWRTAYRLGLDAVAHLAGLLHAADDAAGDTDETGHLHELQARVESLSESFPLAVPALLENRIHPRQRVDGVELLLAHRRQDERLGVLSDHLDRWAEHHAHVSVDADTFAVATGRHTVALPAGQGELRAAGPRGPDLHWSDFTATLEELPETETQEPVPVRLTFDGAPPVRWWGMADPDVDFVTASAGPSDLGRLLLATMLQEQGGVFWALPIDVPANRIVRVVGVELRDGFGSIRHSTAFENDELRGWTMGDGSAPDWMLLLNEPQPLRGAALEEVALVADEYDNLVWMIEDVATDLWGRGHQVPQPAPRPEPDREEYTPRLSPPAAWLAYQQTADNHLERAVLAATGDAGVPRTRFAQERLDATPAMLGAGGRRLRRQWTLARSASGRRLLWEARRSLAQTSRGGSGLLHDQIVRPES